MKFFAAIDNPLFSVRETELIKSKKTQFITVMFEGNPSGPLVTGKLTVTAPSTLPGTSWVFYLKGATEKPTSAQN